MKMPQFIKQVLFCWTLRSLQFFFLSFFLNIYLCIYLAASGLGCGMRDLLLRHIGFSLVVAHGLWNTGSVVVARGLRCTAACGILVPQPGIKPVSPALEGRFFTARPPGKCLSYRNLDQTKCNPKAQRTKKLRLIYLKQ